MLIATSAIVAASALAAGAFAPVNPAPPPIVVNVSAAPNVSPSLVTALLAETGAIFRSANVSFLWRVGSSSLTSLSVSIGNDHGNTYDDVTALGWIVFEDGRPDQQIYLSYANAEQFMLDSRGVTGSLANMTRAEREMLLGRVLGRALAHELGHYLLATKEHTPKGLLKAVRSAQEFFSFDRGRFQLEQDQRTLIAARLNGEAVIASRQRSDGARRSRGTSQ